MGSSPITASTINAGSTAAMKNKRKVINDMLRSIKQYVRLLIKNWPLRSVHDVIYIDCIHRILHCLVPPNAQFESPESQNGLGL